MAAAKKTANKDQNIFTDAQNTMDANAEKFGKGFEDMAAFSQETLEALVKSTEIAAKAAEELNADMAAFTKKSIEDTLAAAKDMSSVKTPVELFEKQAAFATAVFEGFFNQASKWGEAMTTVSKEATAPLAARATAATDLAKSYAA